MIIQKDMHGNVTIDKSKPKVKLVFMHDPRYNWYTVHIHLRGILQDYVLPTQEASYSLTKKNVEFILAHEGIVLPKGSYPKLKDLKWVGTGNNKKATVIINLP